jgi:hypothetical protein
MKTGKRGNNVSALSELEVKRWFIQDRLFSILSAKFPACFAKRFPENQA